MKIRLLLFGLIAMLSVGCSAFFSFSDSSGGSLDREAPAPMPGDTTTTTEMEKSTDFSSDEERIEAPMLMDAVDGDDGFAVGSSASGGFESGEFDSAESIAVAELAPAMEQQVTTLKAGEINDNAEWDDYLLYRRESLENFGDYVNDVDVSGRHIITVNDANGLPILGATITVTADDTIISHTRTYANGQTLFLPYANPDTAHDGPYMVTVEKDNVSETFDMSVASTGPNWEFTLDMQPSRETVKLDVMFLLDATGSMSDEIAQLQENILSISQQIDDMGDVDVRYGLVHYRDRGGEEYITKINDFTPNVADFQSALNGVRADGGGDTPESLNAGLHDALQEVEWRGDDTIKLVFLVADAPPHLDYADDYDYAEEMLYAAEKGIKVHPIASSGLDPVGEYIFRQIGQTTMGNFIFLTYAGGTPGEAGDERSDLAAGEQDYTVDFLDGLVVRLVEDEINAFKGMIEE